MSKIAILSLSCMLVHASAIATVAISFNADSLRTSSGAFAPTGTLAMLVADADGLGFGDITPGAINQYDMVGSGDVIVTRFDFSTAGTPGIILEDISGIQLNGFSGGDQLAIIWFPGLSSADTSVSEGQSYGLLTDPSWVVPTDGGSNLDQYQVISDTNQGAFEPNSNTLNVTDFQSQANLNVVPEPQTYALLAGLATLGVVAYRRRKSRR